MEDCDLLDVVHVNVDFNSFWGGIRYTLFIINIVIHYFKH